MQLYFKKVKETELSEDVYVIPAGLKFGIILLYADLTQNEYLFKKTFNEMKTVRLRYLKNSQKSVCSFEYTVLESLIFTNRLQEIQFLLENNTVQINDDRIFVPKDRKQTHDEIWKILCAAGYHKLRDLEKTKKYLETITIGNLGIGWKKYYSIIYYFVQIDFVDDKEKLIIIEKLQTLINETYFSYFEEKLNEYIENYNQTEELNILSKS